MALEQKHPLTYEDYAALPDDGKRYELIDGVLYQMPSPTFPHQGIALEIGCAIRNYLETHPIGNVCIAPLDVILDARGRRIQVYQPDVLYISRERREIITRANIQGAPDLVIEVLSDSTARRDLGPKKRNYMRYGVREFWIAWQDVARIEIYRLDEAGRYGDPRLLEADDVLTTPLMPGFELPLARLYAGMLDQEPDAPGS